MSNGPHVELDTIWRRIDGKERVRVKRVWLWPDQGWTVRAHPVRGGKVLVADQDWFLEHYAKIERSPSGPEETPMTVAELRKILADMPDTASVLVGTPDDGPREYLEVQAAHGRATPDGWVVLEVEPFPSGPEETP